MSVFGGDPAGPGRFPALLYAPLPLLLWAAVRFGPGGLGFSLLVVALLSLSNAVAGRGPFTTHSPAENVLSLQIFLVAISVPLMLLAALVQERKHVEVALLANQERLALAQEAGRVAAFEWLPDTNAFTWSKELEALYCLESRDHLQTYEAWLTRVHPGDRERAHDAMQRALTTGPSPSSSVWSVPTTACAGCTTGARRIAISEVAACWLSA